MNKEKLCIVDRFEGNFAVIEYGDETFDFPRELLNDNVKEGDVLRFNIIIDKEEKEKRIKMIEELKRKLYRN
jgi:hypothetical protein